MTEEPEFIPKGRKFFCPPNRPDRLWRSQSAYAVTPDDLYPEVKRSICEDDHHLHLIPKLRMREDMPLETHVPLGGGKGHLSSNRDLITAITDTATTSYREVTHSVTSTDSHYTSRVLTGIKMLVNM
jgi:hypothetical protein